MCASVLQTLWKETYDLWDAALLGVGSMFTKDEHREKARRRRTARSSRHDDYDDDDDDDDDERRRRHHRDRQHDGRGGHAEHGVRRTERV
ncbi:hypothetical protein SPI_07544 [Niveomyces insectorum RCEF 264]|uniref:Uncharacterized protein n=1 Tax=Niveomyces insectorum RCEF 264 TaxID=1081102 RepID=A0A167PD43_9HYPO|nr:hypothetical protein SPI_07544 [Niveomyces insectorum RCEF 264]